MHFFSAGLPMVMRKNEPLVPRSNIAGSWALGGGGGQFTRVTSFYYVSGTYQKTFY